MIEERRLGAGRMLEVELPRRLDAFAEAMRLGALQLVARHLLRAGVFRASLDSDNPHKVSIERMVEGVRRAVAARPKLQKFLSEHWNVVVEQADYVNPEVALPKRIRNKERWRETFGGYLNRSLDAAEKMLEQLEALKKRLPVWKSLVRGADVPRVEPIMDYHDSRK
jgi:hypothetical protein